MKIRINERSVELVEGTTLYAVKRQFKPDADIVVYNGFPVGDDISLKDSDEIFFIRRGELPSQVEMEYLMAARHTPGVHEQLKAATVGIAGAGGLGSTVAIALARVGIGRLVIADFDVVEPTNLNRQQYFVDQVGRYKVEALKENLSRINPYVAVEAHVVELSVENIPGLFGGCTVVVEAFDRADMKTMLINTVIEQMPELIVVAASGLAGFGPNNEIRTTALSKRLYIVGDHVSEARPGSGLMAPRVGIAASHQANQVVRILLGETDD